MYFYHQKLLQVLVFQSVKGNTDKLNQPNYSLFFSVMDQCNLFTVEGKEGFGAVVFKLPNAEPL